MTNPTDYPIVEKQVPTFYFVGVTTGKSSIMKVFPRLMEVLGRTDVVIEGIDHQLNDDPEAYRATVAQFKYDPLSLGGLVTTHKINLLKATRDMFDELHSSSELLGETSCISKRGSKLRAHAKDLITGGLSLDAILGDGYFGRTGGHLLCFGAGGSGKALSLHLMNKEDPADRPEQIIITNRSPGKLTALEEMVKKVGTDIEFEYVQNADPKVNDTLMAKLPEGSVVINATGMGKDLPGSPITDEGVFPMNGVAWEINYRGELDFWHQSKAQEKSRSLTVEDGWLYFLHGWTQVIAEVLDIDLDEETFNKLGEVVADLRPELVYKPRTGA